MTIFISCGRFPNEPAATDVVTEPKAELAVAEFTPPKKVPGKESAGLVGPLTVADHPTGIVFHYSTGKPLPNQLITEKVFGAGQSMRDIKIDLRGRLEVPRKMIVQVMHYGGSGNRGIDWLYVDGREVGSVGDDRVKRAVYNLPLEAGTYAVEWRLTGGDFGNGILQFFDPETKKSLRVYVGDEALAATLHDPIDQVVDNDKYETATIPEEIGSQN